MDTHDIRLKIKELMLCQTWYTLGAQQLLDKLISVYTMCFLVNSPHVSSKVTSLSLSSTVAHLAGDECVFPI